MTGMYRKKLLIAAVTIIVAIVLMAIANAHSVAGENSPAIAEPLRQRAARNIRQDGDRPVDGAKHRAAGSVFG